jgi:hypothetical protein
MKMPTRLILLPDVEDIQYFKTAGKDKSENYSLNIIRENVLANIFNIDDEYTNNPINGANWINIQSKFRQIISTLCDVPFNSIRIKHIGGMRNNYDFLILFINDKTISKTVKLEFKHNNSNVKNLVQFIELYDKDCKNKYKICTEMSYAEYYYDNYIDLYLNTDIELTLYKPKRDEYLKNVYDIKYKHEFFDFLHKRKNNELNKKRDVANKSVKKYLEIYSDNFKFDKITEKIRESQKDKYFLLWDCDNFHIKKLDVENINITHIIKKSDLYIDVNVDNFIYNVRIRLNWGNNNGLVNPRWKFSFIDKLEI